MYRKPSEQEECPQDKILFLLEHLGVHHPHLQLGLMVPFEAHFIDLPEKVKKYFFFQYQFSFNFVKISLELINFFLNSLT